VLYYSSVNKQSSARGRVLFPPNPKLAAEALSIRTSKRAALACAVARGDVGQSNYRYTHTQIEDPKKYRFREPLPGFVVGPVPKTLSSSQ
jgi:hypothetical protein